MMISKKELISIRDYLEDDHHFIMATWLSGLYHGSDWFKGIDRDDYFKNYRVVIQKILDKSDIHVRIACLKDDPDVILGYSVLEGPTLHYLFCKPAWRGIGLSTDLIQKDLSVVSHLTEVGRKILEKNYPHVKFKPYSSKESG